MSSGFRRRRTNAPMYRTLNAPVQIFAFFPCRNDV